MHTMNCVSCSVLVALINPPKVILESNDKFIVHLYKKLLALMSTFLEKGRTKEMLLALYKIIFLSALCKLPSLTVDKEV